jgi:spermidine dehydrogenase
MGKITRRDFINGTLVAAGAAMLPREASSQAAMATLDPSYYPPALTGLRGSQPGSNTAAHNRAWNGQSNWGRTTDLKEEYDLVVVGGGLSGLAAAYFYQKKHGADKKILILDNHDDFGGHARRNEHTIDGELRIINGGSQSIVSPHARSETVLDLLKDVGVDLEKFETAYDAEFFNRHDLGAVTFFNEENFGEDKVVNHPFSNYPWWYVGIPRPDLSVEDAVEQAPLSDKGKEQLLRILNGGVHELDVSEEELEAYIEERNYFDYLTETLGIDDPEVLMMARRSCSDWSAGGAELLTISSAMECGALGFPPVESWKAVLGEDGYNEWIEEDGYIYAKRDPFIHHFPGGNAGVARAMVKKMIPSVAEGKNAEELILSRFDYSQLDKPSNNVRLRLNSTVVKVEHDGDPKDSGEVIVTFINNNKSYQVKGKGVVMACYNAMIPHIVPNLPKEQDAALRLQTRMPLVYTSVGLRNWKAWKEMGIGMAMCPGNMHEVVVMDFPISMGGYEFTKSPDEPCVINMISCPTGETVGAPAAEQFAEARVKMLALQFRDYEDEIRAHLSGMLPKESFDFDRDVESITVNRWAHGYAYGGPGNSTEIGRQPFGRITVGNSDAAPSSYAHVAMMEAYRAVNELG